MSILKGLTTLAFIILGFVFLFHYHDEVIGVILLVGANILTFMPGEARN